MKSALERLRAMRSRQHAADASVPTSLAATDLPPDWRELYEERAAIREYDGGQTRECAEKMALAEIVEQMRAAGNFPTTPQRQT